MYIPTYIDIKEAGRYFSLHEEVTAATFLEPELCTHPPPFITLFGRAADAIDSWIDLDYCLINERSIDQCYGSGRIRIYVQAPEPDSCFESRFGQTLAI